MAPAPAAPAKTIVVVDDDAALLGALRFALDTAGFGVRTFQTASTALKAAALEDAACLVLDQNLPDTVGLDLLAALRGLGVKTPAILITSSPSAAVLAQAAALGAPVVEKPLLDDGLFACIRRLSA